MIVSQIAATNKESVLIVSMALIVIVTMDLKEIPVKLVS